MTSIYILGDTSFLARNFYVYLKKHHKEIYLINHENMDTLTNIEVDDVLINFCGVNRADKWDDYNKGNAIFLKEVLSTINTEPFFIHISSYMTHGFKDKDLSDLGDYQKWFIKSKLDGENYLQDNYPREKLCIIYPSNIYGYNCIPYYNNIVSTLVYEKLSRNNKINKFNKNCIRNMLSIDGFCTKLYEVFENRSFGNHNIISNNNIRFEKLIECIHDTTPSYIEYFEGDHDEMNSDTLHNTIIVEENIVETLRKLENDMRAYLELKEKVVISKPGVLSQPRGDMVEISNLESRRLYKITLGRHAVRGNHFHYKQTEEFFTNRGKVLYLLSHKDNPNIVFMVEMKENTSLKIQPNIIHTLINDYIDNHPEIIIGSTQEYIAGETPDTKYINIV